MAKINKNDLNIGRGENNWDKTKRQYPELAAKGYVFRTNMDRDASKGKRRKTKQWCKKVVKHLHFDDNIFTVLFGVIRDDLPAYSSYGMTEMSDFCPVFGKMQELFPDGEKP